MKYDKTDTALLRVLREDSRATIAHCTEQTGIPKSTVHERVRRLVRNGVRCTPLIDWEAVGCPLLAFFVMPAKPEELDESVVNTCVRLAPNVYVLECCFPTMRALEEFRAQHPGAKCYPVVSTLKREGFIPRDDAIRTQQL